MPNGTTGSVRRIARISHTPFRRVRARPAPDSDPVRRQGPERGSTGGGGRPRSFPSGPPSPPEVRRGLRPHHDDFGRSRYRRASVSEHGRSPHSRPRLRSSRERGSEGPVATKVGINGFGRIGRNFYRAYLKRRPGFEVVAVNDLADPEVLAHVLKYDSTHGVLDVDISASEEGISVNGETFKVLSEREPAQLPWGELGVELVVESTGLFTDREGASKHLEAGAKKVIISAPATDPDVTIVL